MDPHAALELLEYLRTSYPIFLLILFVVAFVVNTTIAAKKAGKHEAQYFGPGGRPLPQQTRSTPTYKSQEFSRNVKRVFNLLSAVVILTFLADAIIYIIHVMVARSENWWRGQSFVVRSTSNGLVSLDSTLTLMTGLRRRLLLRLLSAAHGNARHISLAYSRPICLLVGRHPDRIGYC